MQNDDRNRGRGRRGGGQGQAGHEGNFSGGRGGGPRGPQGRDQYEYGERGYEQRGYGGYGAGWQDEGGRYAMQSHRGDWDHDEPFYGRGQGGQPPQYGYGRPNPHGPQYEQGGRYPGTRPLGDRQWLGSRSDDPGQSSYGGFRGEDPSYQRQDLRTAGARRRWHEAAWDDEMGADLGYGEHGYGGYGHGMAHGGGTRDWRARPDEGRWGGDEPSGASYPAGRFPARQSRIDPRGYVRSDERVRENVCEHLSHSGLDVRDVEVNVKDGQVTLQGSVPDRRTKHAVEDCVEDCSGVKDVENRVKVSAGGSAGAAHG